MSAPSKLTGDNILKLKEAASWDCTYEEMALHCGVSEQTIYNWKKIDPKLFEEIQLLRHTPVLTARKTVIQKMEDSYLNSIDYLKRKQKGEFGDNIDMTTKGEGLQPLLVKIIGKEEKKDE